MRRSVAWAKICSGPPDRCPWRMHSALGGCGPLVRTIPQTPIPQQESHSLALCRPTIGTHQQQISPTAPWGQIPPALGGCGPLVRTIPQTPIPQQESHSLALCRPTIGTHQQQPPNSPSGQILRFRWVRTVGPHNPSDTCTPAGIPPLWHCAGQRPVVPIRPRLPPLPTCSASTWPRSSGPRRPAPG